MAKGNDTDSQMILREVASEEATSDVHIEQGLRLIELYCYKTKEIERKISKEIVESDRWDELIEMKKQELDKQVKQLDEIRSFRELLQLNTETLKNHVQYLLKEKTEKRRMRNTIKTSWQELIACEQEKMNAHPLIVERKKLESEVLAASVESRVLEYRIKEERKRRDQMRDIEYLKLTNTIIKLAQQYVEVQKLEEKKKFLLQEVKNKSNNVESIELMDQTGEAIHETSTSGESMTDEQPVNDVLKNFRQMSMISKIPLATDLPTVLSQNFEIKTKNIELHSEVQNNQRSSHDSLDNVNDVLKNLRMSTPFRTLPPSSGLPSLLSQNFETKMKNLDAANSIQKGITSDTCNEEKEDAETEKSPTSGKAMSSLAETGSKQGSENSVLEQPMLTMELDENAGDGSESRMPISKTHTLTCSPQPDSHLSCQVARESRASSAAKTVRTNSPSSRPTHQNDELKLTGNKKRTNAGSPKPQSKFMKTDNLFASKKLLSSQQQSFDIVDQIQKKSGVKFNQLSGYSEHSGGYPMKRRPAKQIYYAPRVQNANRSTDGEIRQPKDIVEMNNCVASTYFDGIVTSTMKDNEKVPPSPTGQQFLFAGNDRTPNKEVYLVQNEQDYSSRGSNQKVASVGYPTQFETSLLPDEGQDNDGFQGANFHDDEFMHQMFNVASRRNSDNSKSKLSTVDTDNIFGFGRDSPEEEPFSFFQSSARQPVSKDNFFFN